MGPAHCMYNYAHRAPSPEPPPAVTATTAYTPLERPECAVEGESSLRPAALPLSGCIIAKRPLVPVQDGKQPSARVSTTGVLLGPDAHSCQSEAECLRACVQHWPQNGCTGSDSPPAADSRLLRSGISRDSAQLCTSAIVIDDGLVCLEPAHLAEVGHRHDPLCTTGQAAAAVPARTSQPQCTHNGAELSGLAAVSGDNPSSTDCPTDVNQATCNVTSSAPGAPSAVVAPLSLAQPRSSYGYAVKFGAAGPHFGDVAPPRSSAALDTALDHPLGPVEYPHPQPVQDADDEAYAICAGNGSIPTEGAVAHSDPAPYRQNAQFDTYGN